VDDDEEIRLLLSSYLQKNFFDVSVAGNGEEMDRCLADTQVDLLILDVMLPGENGLEICRRVRVNQDIPIIMLTARGEDTDRIVGLEVGADDYLPKPFNPRELLARIRGVLRRAHRSVQSASELHQTEQYRFGQWVLEVAQRTLLTPQKVTIPLSGAEFKLLQIFLDRPGRILSRDFLMDQIQGRESSPFDRSIDVQISRLRQRLGDSGRSPQVIKTVRGEGYQFTLKVEK
jgi:two-component system OmpR family response regulator